MNRKYKSYLHNAIKAHGIDNFEFKVVYTGVDIEYTRRVLEPLYIESFKSHVSQGGYNLTQGGDGSSGFKHREESRLAMSCRKSPEHIEKVAKAIRGIKRPDQSLRVRNGRVPPTLVTLYFVDGTVKTFRTVTELHKVYSYRQLDKLEKGIISEYQGIFKLERSTKGLIND